MPGHVVGEVLAEDEALGAVGTLEGPLVVMELHVTVQGLPVVMVMLKFY